MCLEASAEAHMKSWVFRGLRPEVLEFKALSEQHSETLAQEINVLNSLPPSVCCSPKLWGSVSMATVSRHALQVCEVETT